MHLQLQIAQKNGNLHSPLFQSVTQTTLLKESNRNELRACAKNPPKPRALQTDAEVYVYLLTNGPLKAGAIAEALRVYKQQLYRSLKRLTMQRLQKSQRGTSRAIFCGTIRKKF